MAAHRDGVLSVLRHRRRDRRDGEPERLHAEAERTAALAGAPLGKLRVVGTGARALLRQWTAAGLPATAGWEAEGARRAPRRRGAAVAGGAARVIPERDFSTRRRPRGRRAADVALLAVAVALLAAAVYAAASAWADARQARASYEEVRAGDRRRRGAREGPAGGGRRRGRGGRPRGVERGGAAAPRRRRAGADAAPRRAPRGADPALRRAARRRDDADRAHRRRLRPLPPGPRVVAGVRPRRAGRRVPRGRGAGVRARPLSRRARGHERPAGRARDGGAWPRCSTSGWRARCGRRPPPTPTPSARRGSSAATRPREWPSCSAAARPGRGRWRR